MWYNCCVLCHTAVLCVAMRCVWCVVTRCVLRCDVCGVLWRDVCCDLMCVVCCNAMCVATWCVWCVVTRCVLHCDVCVCVATRYVLCVATRYVLCVAAAVFCVMMCGTAAVFVLWHNAWRYMAKLLYRCSVSRHNALHPYIRAIYHKVLTHTKNASTSCAIPPNCMFHVKFHVSC